jgi:hypothetical protein
VLKCDIASVVGSVLASTIVTTKQFTVLVYLVYVLPFKLIALARLQSVSIAFGENNGLTLTRFEIGRIQSLLNESIALCHLDELR